MAQLTVPAADAVACQSWSEQDRNLYNRLPFYLAKMQVDHVEEFSVWPKLIGETKWIPNMGDTMRAVTKEPSPYIRQFAFPNLICDLPKVDIIGVRERSVDAAVRRHRFESPIMNFCPDFRDFLTDHVDYTAEDINKKKAYFNDVFIRGNIFHQSPNVFFPNRVGGELVTGAPTGNGNAAGTDGKTTAWLQAQLVTIGNPGNLSLNAINLAVTIMETDLAIPAFKGNNLPQGDNAPLNAMYCLVLSGEAYNQFIYDPWLLKNKDINLDVIKSGFRGSLFGRVICKLESKPMRMLADGTFPAPEVIVENGETAGETVPNPAYVNAPYEVAFLVGGSMGYKAIKVGPPPRAFAGNGMPKGFGQMFWNGENIITKNLMIKCLDEEGNVTQTTNMYGEYLKIISQATFGIVGQQKRSIMPIIFKRTRGAQNPI